MEVTLKKILDIYEQEIRKHVKNKYKLYQFERFKMSLISEIYDELLASNINYPLYNVFVIMEPKYRVVMSLNIKDKIINHYLTRHVLMPKLEGLLDMRNTATRKGMGMDYSIRLLKKYFNNLKNKYDNIYVLKLDISKYFYTIDHDVLKREIRDYLDEDEYNLISKVIDSSNSSYINDDINKWMNELNIKLPIYEYGKGLPIGNMTSQFLSIFYLNKLDHYIVHDLHLPNYVRYMDDFIILDNDLEHLRKCQKEIIAKLENVYKLKINKNKTSIVNARTGVVFLGYFFKISNNKLNVVVRNETWKKLKKNIKKRSNEYQKQMIGFDMYFASINNFLYTFKYGGKKKINKYIYRYMDKLITYD